MTALHDAARQALAFTMRDFASLRDFEAARAVLHDNLRAALAQQAEPVEPVATVTECEACFTPDVCQLRGTCDYYTASQMRIAAPQQQAEPMALDWLHKWANQDDGEPETQWHEGYEAARRVVQIHLTTPPPRKPLTEEEIESIWRQKPRWHAPPIGTTDIEFARAVERAHGIGGEE